MKRFTKALMATSMAIAVSSLAAGSALATDGMLPNGVGARNSALAGAGVADQNDASAIAVNPAGLVNVDTQLNMSASLFSPHRAASMGLGEIKSDSNYFVIPSMFYSVRLDANRAVGVGMYAAGGMNTDYPTNPFNPGFTGVRTGIDLNQVIMSFTYAQRFGNVAIGLAPTVGLQIFNSHGLGVMGLGSGTDTAAGVALRGGLEWDIRPNFRFGLAASTPGWVQAFTDYKAAFPSESGALRQPAFVQTGIAFDVMPNLTIMADYKRIFYAGSPAMGTDFGWDDINVYKFGAEWDVNPALTLRAGYSYNDNPLPPINSNQGVFVASLTPATVKHHITGGAKLKMNDSYDFEMAGMYAPEEKFSGPFGYAKMYQWQLTAGVIWHLGSAEAPLK